MVGAHFPGVYLEFPLIGDPLLDVTVLYDKLEPGTRIHSRAAADTERMLDWFASVQAEYDEICCGFELDVHEDPLPRAAVHFPPRRSLGGSYPSSLSSHFAMPSTRLKAVFDEIGFRAYDETLLSQVCSIFQLAPKECDFQFDVYPDGSLGDIFAIDTCFKIERPELVRDSFESGPFAKLFGLLEQWDTADERWRLAAGAAFARALPVELEDGKEGAFSLALLPQWVKTRWRNGVLQPAKLYYLGTAKVLDGQETMPA